MASLIRIPVKATTKLMSLSCAVEICPATNSRRLPLIQPRVRMDARASLRSFARRLKCCLSVSPCGLLAEDKKDDGLVFDELGVDHVFIDEAQFLSKAQVWALHEIAHMRHVPAIFARTLSPAASAAPVSAPAANTSAEKFGSDHVK